MWLPGRTSKFSPGTLVTPHSETTERFRSFRNRLDSVESVHFNLFLKIMKNNVLIKLSRIIHSFSGISLIAIHTSENLQMLGLI